MYLHWLLLLLSCLCANYTIVMFQISAAAVAPDACGQLCERAEKTQEVLYILDSINALIISLHAC